MGRRGDSALVWQGWVCYRDIVVTPGLWTLIGSSWRGCLPSMTSPCFRRIKPTFCKGPCLPLITAALDAVNGGHLYEDMFRYLKTGLAGLEPAECDQLENYVHPGTSGAAAGPEPEAGRATPGDTIGLRPRTRRRWRPSMPSACG